MMMRQNKKKKEEKKVHPLPILLLLKQSFSKKKKKIQSRFPMFSPVLFSPIHDQKERKDNTQSSSQAFHMIPQTQGKKIKKNT